MLLLPAWMRPAQWRIYPATPDHALFCLFWIACAAAVVYALRNFRPGAIAASVGIVAYLSMTYVYIFAMPATEQYRGEKPFGELISHQLRDDMARLAFFRVEGPLFYMDTSEPVPMYDDPAALKRAINTGGVRWVVARRRDVDDLETLGVPATIVAAEATFPWENEVRNKQVLLRVWAAWAHVANAPSSDPHPHLRAADCQDYFDAVLDAVAAPAGGSVAGTAADAGGGGGASTIGSHA